MERNTKSVLYTSLSLRFGRCHVTKPLFGNCNREYEVMQQKFPIAIPLKIILCDDFQADGEC